MDEILYKLRLSGFGCHVGNTSIPAIGYADDVALLAPAISSLKLLLNVVNSFGNEYCVKINPDKSKLLVFGKSYNSDINIVFNDSIGGHGGRVVTLSPPTSEDGVRFPAWPQVGKLVVASHWLAVYSTEP